MNFYKVIEIITNEPPVFNKIKSPVEILNSINEKLGREYYNYDNTFMFKDQETTKLWFNMLFNKYFNYCFYVERNEISEAEQVIILIRKLTELFNHYEALYLQFKPLIDKTKEKINFFENIIKTNSEGSNIFNNQPSQEEEENFPSTITKNNNTITVENKNNTLTNFLLLKNEYNDIINTMVNYCDDFFILDIEV